MKKLDIAAHVAVETSLSKRVADVAVNAVFDAIGDALAKGKLVRVPGFGTFSVKSRSARQGRNPRTGESIEIAGANVPSFKAGKGLRDAVN